MPSLNTGNAILSNPIKVDSSYNVGIGGAASGSFKLQVTGTTNLTGALSGTSATFSGGVTAASFTANGLIYGRANASFPASGLGYYALKTNNFDGERGGLTIQVSSSTNTLTDALTINYLGAATFSSSVTAGDLLSTSYGSARIQVTSTTNSANSGLRYGARDSAGTAKNAGIYYVAGTTTATTFLSLAADDNNYQFNVLANGNVGIGTSSPVNALHVRGVFGGPVSSGSSQNGIARFGQTSGNGCLDVGFGDPYSWIQSRNASDYATVYSLALQPTGGNVGIGVTTPYTKLQTNGSVGMGTNSNSYPINAKFVKQSTNTVTFTANLGTLGAWRPGYASIRVATAQNGLQEYRAAWFFIRIVSYFAGGAVIGVVDSGGDVGSYTFSSTATNNGSQPQVVTFTIADADASTDTIIADIDLSYTEGIISLS